ncbi:ArnT family glycosyltransferase [Rufibacter soli]
MSFTLLYFFAEHEGFYFGDDFSYGLYAHQLLHGGFHFDDYSFCHRFMVFVPTALFYWLWGMNVYTTTLWPLLCTLGTYLAIFLTFRKSHPVATSWALVLMGFYYFQLNTVNYLYPDNILLFFSTACLLVLYKARKPLPSLSAEIGYGVLFAVLNLLAFLTKETIVYAAPFYLVIFLYHLLRKENLHFWAAAILSGALLLGVYFLLYKLYAGNAWQRFEDIAATNTVETKQAYLDTRSATLLPRLTYQPLLFFIGSGLGIPLAFIALCFLCVPRPRLVAQAKTHSFWLMALLSMLLPIWFGTATVDFYKPMPLVPRMFHPLLPAFCLAGALAVERAWGQRSSYALLAGLFLVFTVLAEGTMWTMYLPLALFFTALFLWRRPVPHWLGLAAVLLVCLIRPAYFITKPTVSYYFEQKQIIDQHLSNPTGTHVVVTDSMMARMHPYFYGYEVPKNYTYLPYKSADSSIVQKADTVFLLINNGILEHPELMMPIREKDVLPKFPQAKLIAQEGKVKLFLLPPKK